MQTETASVIDLACDPANARKHDERNIAAIRASLEKFGQQKPIVVDADGKVVAGNGTLEAARLAGWPEIAVVRTGLAAGDAKAYAIADNRTAELAEWDKEILAAALADLRTAEDVDHLAAGFTEEEIDRCIRDAKGGEVVEDEPPEAQADAISKPGDLWLLGDHRVLCGDSTVAGDVERVMGGEKAGLVFTSPPYAQQRDYEQKIEDWDGLMQGVFSQLPAIVTESAQVLVNLGLIHRDGEWIPYWDSWIEWMRAQGWRRFGWYVWDQGAGMMGDWGGRFAPSHEWVFHFNRASVKPVKWMATTERGPKGANDLGMRKRDGSIGKITAPEKCGGPVKIPDGCIRVYREQSRGIHTRGHPAVFPPALPAYVIQSWPCDVFDPFLGSGTTLIAAEQLGRKCYGIEIEPRYVDVTVRRWEKLTGKAATLDGDGRTFAEVQHAKG